MDLNKDKYTIFNSDVKLVIDYLLVYEISFQKNKYIAIQGIDMAAEEFHNIIERSILNKILKRHGCETRYDKTVSKKLSYGVKFEDWSVEGSEFSKKLGIFYLLSLLIALFKTRVLLKFAGIKWVIKKINHKRPKELIDDKQMVSKLIHDLNTACLYFPTSTKCLEWAITYIFLAYKQKIDCSLVIGVQTSPFVAHAWVEYKKVPFSDSSHIASAVARILIEPAN